MGSDKGVLSEVRGSIPLRGLYNILIDISLSTSIKYYDAVAFYDTIKDGKHKFWSVVSIV